jgi:hypothetical protein
MMILKARKDTSKRKITAKKSSPANAGRTSSLGEEDADNKMASVSIGIKGISGLRRN